MGSGLYIVTLNNNDPISVNQGDKRIRGKLNQPYEEICIKVNRANCKFGKAKNFEARRQNYIKTFGQDNIVFTPLFEMGDIVKGEKIVLEKLKKYRARNPFSHRITEWLENIEAVEVKKIAQSALLTSGLSFKQFDAAYSMLEIESTFNAHFKRRSFSIPQSSISHRQQGKIVGFGWAIWYLFGLNEKGEYLDYYASHRMTDDCHKRIYASGQIEFLPAFPWARECSTNLEEDKKLEAEFITEILRVEKLLHEKGFGLDGNEPGGVLINRILLTTLGISN